MRRIDPRTALAAIAARHRTITEGDWRGTIASFAEHVSDGAWKPYAWLVYVERIIREALDKGGARIILNVPPRHGKSLLVSQYLPAWILDQDPTQRIILASYESGYAAEWGKKVRDLCDSRGDIRPSVRPDVSARKHWETLHGGSMITAGVGAALTGRGSFVLILDDPTKNWEQAYSKVHQLMLQNWFDSTFITRAEPGASVIIIMTRWSPDDLTAYLAKRLGYIVIALPAIAEENDPMGRAIGEALCPERYPVEALLRMRDEEMGTRKFDAMYQQRPSSIEGQLVKRDWWGFYDEIPPAFDDSLLSWDMTFKKTETGSYVAGGGIGRLGAQYFMLPRLVHKRMSFVETQQAVLQQKAQYPWTIGTLIENKANGPAIKDSLKQLVDDIIDWEPQGKLAQASAVSPIVEAGNFLLPNPAVFPESKEWIDSWISEWSDFPTGAHDDLVDMGSQGVLKLRQRSNVHELFIGRA